MANTDPNNRSLILVRPDLEGLPPVDIPSNITFRPYEPGDEAVWTRIWQDSEPFDTIDASQFRRSYGFDDDLLAQRVHFAVDTVRGVDVGTVTAWSQPESLGTYGPYTGWGRVHWLATLPAYQGRGIGKALFLFCLHQLKQFGHRESFLMTSTARIGAVALYRKYGFRESDIE